jgi:imidazolonepropionase-like amidohydrolase
LLIQNGKVIAAGTVNIPKNTITVNLEGKSIYPSFIDMYTSFGMDKRKQKVHDKVNRMTQNEKAITGMNIRSEVNAYDNFNYDQPKAEELLKAGFGGHACSRRYRERHRFTDC